LVTDAGLVIVLVALGVIVGDWDVDNDRLPLALVDTVSDVDKDADCVAVAVRDAVTLLEML